MKNEGSTRNVYPIAAVAALAVAVSAFVVSANWWTPTGDTGPIGANIDTSVWQKGSVLGDVSDIFGIEHTDWKWFEEETLGFRVRVPDSHEVVMENSVVTEYGLTAGKVWQIAPKSDANGEYPIYPALLSVSAFSNSERLSIGEWHQKEIAGWNVNTEACRKTGSTAGCFSYDAMHPTDRPTVFQEWFAVETLQNTFDVLQSCHAVDRGSEVIKLCIIRYGIADGDSATRLAEEIGSTFEFTR